MGFGVYRSWEADPQSARSGQPPCIGGRLGSCGLPPCVGGDWDRVDLPLGRGRLGSANWLSARGDLTAAGAVRLRGPSDV